jgi:hypothetical protein
VGLGGDPKGWRTRIWLVAEWEVGREGVVGGGVDGHDTEQSAQESTAARPGTIRPCSLCVSSRRAGRSPALRRPRPLGLEGLDS